MIEFAHDRHEIRQLHRALHLRVARENLLDERGARARQSDDEDRRGIGTAGTGMALQEVGVEAPRHPPRLVLECDRIEVERPPPRRVARGIVAERPRPLASLFVRAAERELELGRIGRRRRGRPLGRRERLHRRDLGVGEPVILEIREAAIGFAEIRLEREPGRTRPRPLRLAADARRRCPG